MAVTKKDPPDVGTLIGTVNSMIDVETDAVVVNSYEHVLRILRRIRNHKQALAERTDG